jgi:hypothetical protein
VAQAPLKDGAAAFYGFFALLFEVFADFLASTGGFDDFELVFGGLGALTGDDFYLVGILELVAKEDGFAIDFGGDSMSPDFRVDFVGEIQRGGAVGEDFELAFGREDVDFILGDFGAELANEVDVWEVGVLQEAADAGKPSVQRFVVRGGLAVFLGFFVAPVRDEAVLGGFMHAAGTDLDLYPFAFGAHDGDVKGFVTGSFGLAEPVSQTVVVGAVELGDD